MEFYTKLTYNNYIININITIFFIIELSRHEVKIQIKHSITSNTCLNILFKKNNHNFFSYFES